MRNKYYVKYAKELIGKFYINNNVEDLEVYKDGFEFIFGRPAKISELITVLNNCTDFKYTKENFEDSIKKFEVLSPKYTGLNIIYVEGA